MKKTIEVTQRDGSVWAVDVMEVANNRAKHYAHEYKDDTEESLKEDTMPLFKSDEYEIKDWALNNMNWSDFKTAREVRKAKPLTARDFQQAWNDSDNVMLV